MTDNPTRGERVKALRQTHNLTQRMVAEAIGTTVVQVGLWERGKFQPSDAYWRRICEVWPEVEK